VVALGPRFDSQWGRERCLFDEMSRKGAGTKETHTARTTEGNDFRVKLPRREADRLLYLMLSLRMRGVIPSLLSYTFIVLCLIKLHLDMTSYQRVRRACCKIIYLYGLRMQTSSKAGMW
jgi:hypothetical protein